MTTSLWRLQAGVTRFPSPFVEGFGWDDETGELEFPGATPSDTTAQACYNVAADWVATCSCYYGHAN